MEGRERERGGEGREGEREGREREGREREREERVNDCSVTSLRKGYLIFMSACNII
jgi:hypothetical protein